MSEKPPSDFLVIFIPHDDSGVDLWVEEFSDAWEATKAVLEAKDKPHLKDAVEIYRHHGRGALDNKWWVGAASTYWRRNR